MSMSKTLEKLMRDFLWERIKEGRGLHLVEWVVVTKPIDARGLDIGNLRAHSSAFLAKWL